MSSNPSSPPNIPHPNLFTSQRRRTPMDALDALKEKNLIKEQQKQIQELKEDRDYWKDNYNNVLHAYFELHSNYNKLTLPKSKLTKVSR